MGTWEGRGFCEARRCGYHQTRFEECREKIMERRLRIAMIASECVPFAKTGGLADVVGALPKALKALGHDVLVVMPKYGSIDAAKYGLRPFFGQMCVWMGNTEEWCAVQVASTGGTDTDGDVPVYFIESDKYFDRQGLYHDAELHDYGDNARRFAFLTPTLGGPRHGIRCGHRPRPRLADRAGARLSQDLALE